MKQKEYSFPLEWKAYPKDPDSPWARILVGGMDNVGTYFHIESSPLPYLFHKYYDPLYVYNLFRAHVRNMRLVHCAKPGAKATPPATARPNMDEFPMLIYRARLSDKLGKVIWSARCREKQPLIDDITKAMTTSYCSILASVPLDELDQVPLSTLSVSLMPICTVGVFNGPPSDHYALVTEVNNIKSQTTDLDELEYVVGHKTVLSSLPDKEYSYEYEDAEDEEEDSDAFWLTLEDKVSK